jgi:hypothetical protein
VARAPSPAAVDLGRIAFQHVREKHRISSSAEPVWSGHSCPLPLTLILNHCRIAGSPDRDQLVPIPPFSNSADKWGWGSFEGCLGTGTPLSCHRSISIVADGRLEDGAYRVSVMKKGRGRIAEATLTSPPKWSLDPPDFQMTTIGWPAAPVARDKSLRSVGPQLTPQSDNQHCQDHRNGS